MALRAIKDFPKATPSTEDLILIEQQGGGRSVSLKELPVSIPVEKKISDVKKDLNDKISALAFEPGDTTGDAELRNIRTPADGFTVPANANAGDAVRAQVTQLDGKISNLKGDLVEINKKIDDRTNTRNINPIWIENHYRNRTIGGLPIEGTGYRTSEPIELKKGEVISFKTGNSNWYFCAYAIVNENNESISVKTTNPVDTSNSYEYLAESDCYISISGRNDLIGDEFIIGIDNTISIKERLTNLETADVIEKDITTGIGYINKKGAIATNSKYGYVEYHLDFGDKVVYSANVDDNNVLVGIGVYDENGQWIEYENVLSNGNNTVEWTCDHNGRIVRSSYQVSNGYTIKFSNEINNDSENIGNIRSDVDSQRIDFEADFYSAMVDNVVCIGDSMTWGSDGKGQIVDNYTRQIEKMSRGWTTTNLGHSGLSATQYWNLYASKADYSEYDTAIIYLGLNNGLAGEATDPQTGEVEDNEGNYRNIINKLLSDNPNMKIFLCTLHESYCSTTNPVIKQIANDYGLTYADLEPLRAYASDKTWHPNDNVHFSKKGYFYMAKIIYETICNAIYNDVDKYSN